MPEDHPRLARVLGAGAAPVVAAALRRLAAEPAAAPAAGGLACAAARLEALASDGALRPDPTPPGATAPRPLVAPLVVDAGLRPLVGELAWLCLESGRPRDAACLFGALETLAAGQPAGAVGLAATFLSVGDAPAAVGAARRAVAAAPADPVAVSSLAEALVCAGRPAEARRVLGRAPAAAAAAAGGAATWLRLLRVGLEEGWLAGAAEAVS